MMSFGPSWRACASTIPRRETMEIVGEIHRCLKLGGYLLARLNSTNGKFYANVGEEEVEENLYLVDGMPKRLFDRESIGASFAEGWEITSAEEQTTERLGGSKTLWEVAARKRPET